MRKKIVYPKGAPLQPFINSTGGGGGGVGTGEVYTTAEKNKLASITEIFTTALKSAYDGAASWIAANSTAIAAHLASTANPHAVTKSQVGLGNVDNTADADKPVSTAQATAIGLKQTKAIQVTAVSVSTAGWTLVSGFYEKSISDSNITASSIVDVIPDNASVSIVQAAEFTSLTTSAAGSVKVYAKNVPTAAITVTLNIWL